MLFFFFSSRRRHTRLQGDWSSDVCSSDLLVTITVSIFFEGRYCSTMRRIETRIFRIDTEVAEQLEDRKSTRLNSSHLVISYAVFCLKKKKNKHTTATPGRKYNTHRQRIDF